MKNQLSTWSGQVSDTSFAYQISIAKAQLHYSFCCKPYSSAPKNEPVSFKAGLWKEDVAELFLTSKYLIPAYYEFHVAPNGSWWVGEFSDYREQTCEIPDLIIERTSEVKDDEWNGSLTVPIKDLKLGDKSDIRFHASSILYREEPIYLTSASSPGGKPDFHRADLFKPLGTCQPG